MNSPADLRKLRVDAGLSQRALAAKAGVGLSAVQRLEAGDGARPENARKIAEFFGLKATDLMPVERSAA